LIRANPGITIPQLAAKMGINANYLYRLLPPLEQQGKIHKDGRGWHPKKA
jgi:DNA-binding IclR family transcriptional regulator